MKWQKKNLLTMLILILTMLIIGCSEQDAIIEEIPEFRSVFSDEGDQGFSLGARLTDEEELGSILLMDSLQDSLTADFGNFSGHDRYFIFKVYYNFEEVNFNVTNLDSSEEFENHYIFFLETEQEISIPFVLEDSSLLNDGEYYGNLTISIMMGIDSFQKEVQSHESNVYGMSSNFHILIEPDKEVRETIRESILTDEFFYYSSLPWREPLLNKEFTIPPRVLGFSYYDFHVTYNKSDDELINFPPFYIQARSSEVITLDYLIGELVSMESDFNNTYAVWGLLNWEQVLINENRFLLLQLNRDYETNEVNAHHGTFTIQAPTEPGYYELIFYAMPLIEVIPGLSTIVNTYRITIVVED